MKIVITAILSLIHLSLFSQKNCDKYNDEYVPINLKDALSYFECTWSIESQNQFRLINENDATVNLHFSYGRKLRNNWGLWKMNSQLSKYFVNIGINHPDDMSDILLVSFHRKLNNKSINLEHQVQTYKDYWERQEIQHLQRQKEKIMVYSVGDTVTFTYDFDFISSSQEQQYENESCIATAQIVAIDTINFELEILLLESCDPNGIIILRELNIDYKNDNIKPKWIDEIMLVGEIKKSTFEIWEKK